jgi:hypothetical protein
MGGEKLAKYALMLDIGAVSRRLCLVSTFS